MQEQMVLQIRMLREPSGTYVAFVRPGAAVDVHVRFEVSRCREGLGAKTALMRFFL